MKSADFSKLVQSIKEAGKIRRGQRRASRTVRFRPDDVRTIRRRLGKSQVEFALMIGVSPATLRNWEQGRRIPDGPARALLKVAAANPRAVVLALAG
jgi:putative transcriptional regulator